jgi:CheY-like chemotaxis protein
MKEQDPKKTVLIVDDAPSNIQMVNSILKDSYKVRIATNGAKALELVRAMPAPDLILLDVMMPGMDGYEVCTRLKADAETKDIPVIFLTGQTETQDETRGFDVGAVDYIHKPFSPAVVKARVQTHLVLRAIREQLAMQLLAIQKELETARQIQLSILPREIPQIHGLEIVARYIPMSAVAGDFYDFIVVDNKRIGILVADVSGHGMPAALIASMLKIAFAAQTECAADPAQVLQGLNRALCGKFQQHYVTAAYIYVDMEQRTLRYGGAGHPPLVLWGGATGEVRKVEENGLFQRRGSRAVRSAHGFVSEETRPRCSHHRQAAGDSLRSIGSRFGRGYHAPSSSLRDHRFQAGGIATWLGSGCRWQNTSSPSLRPRCAESVCQYPAVGRYDAQ